VLAAWVEGGLSDREIALAEAHVADCSRCQALVAAMAKGPQPVPVAAPWWRRAWGFPILVPLTAGAAAVALWIASPAYQSRVSPERAAEQVQAEAQAKQQPSAVERSQPAAPPANEELQQAASPSSRRDETKDTRQQVDRARDAAGARKLEKSDVETREKSVADQVAAEPQKLPVKPAEPSVSGVAQPSTAAAPATPPPAAAAPPTANTTTRATASLRAFGLAVRTGGAEIISPNSSVRWRVGSAGSIQRSADGGTSWQTSVSGVSVDLTAGMSPSGSVCWIVGRSGTVLLSSDGVEWRRLPFPETVDLTGVQAADARSASVTAADGRRFRTTDAGVTWTLVQDF
jgi:hypothetical protein